MSPKECLVQFKEAYCEKDSSSRRDPEFRCDECSFRQNDDICLINSFICKKEEK